MSTPVVPPSVPLTEALARIEALETEIRDVLTLLDASRSRGTLIQEVRERLVRALGRAPGGRGAPQ